MSTSLSLYHIEDELRALVDTAEAGVEGEDQRLAILEELGEKNEQALAKRDGVIRFLRRLSYILDTDRKKGVVGAIDREIDALKAFKEKMEAGRERFERYLVSVVERFGVEPKGRSRRIEGSIGTLSIRKNADRVDISNMDALPPEYVDVTVTMPALVWEEVLAVLPVGASEKVEFSARKAEIKAAIQAGQDVPGAELVYGVNRLHVT
jgi:hypothetical protein